MSSALQRARQLKDQKVSEKRTKRHKEQQERSANQRQINRMKQVIESTLSEFEGVNDIYFTKDERHFVLCQGASGPSHGELILRAWVDWHSYDNPNYEYKVTETELAYVWGGGLQPEHYLLGEEAFVESISEHMADYV